MTAPRWRCEDCREPFVVWRDAQAHADATGHRAMRWLGKGSGIVHAEKPRDPCRRCGTRQRHGASSSCARAAVEAGRRAAAAHPDRRAMAAVADQHLAAVADQPRWVREDLAEHFAAGRWAAA